MSKPQPPDDEDLKFFQHAMKDVKRTKAHPLKTFSMKHDRQGIKRAIQDIQAKDEKQGQTSLSDPAELSVAAEEKLFFKKVGLQERQMKQLEQGKIRPQSILDLHGLTVDQARTTLSHFLSNSQTKGMRCVLIIHGKSHFGHKGPLLKNHVNAWLTQIPSILAFVSAQPRDGGKGAVYVLLSKLKIDKK